MFFDREDDATPSRVYQFDPAANRTYHYWHEFVSDVSPGQIYGYRVDGSSIATSGLRFDSGKPLLDPYDHAVVIPEKYSREEAKRKGDNTATAVKSVVVNSNSCDWEGDVPLSRPSSHTVIYEMHVRGLLPGSD